jgi:hypothetical protein
MTVQVAPSSLSSFLRRAAGNAVVVAHLPSQRSLPYASRSHIEARRDARIARMVRYAARTVPHYRDLFRDLRIDPRSIVGPRDLERLPILDKDELVRDPDRFVSTSRDGRSSIRFISSGSSGKPARIHHDRRSLLENIAYGERERRVTVDILGRQLGYREATFLVHLRLFEVSSDRPLWHAIHSDTHRFSIGWFVRPWSLRGAVAAGVKRLTDGVATARRARRGDARPAREG